MRTSDPFQYLTFVNSNLMEVGYRTGFIEPSKRFRSPMPSSNFIHFAVAFAAAFIAGGINSVAGGGTLISFPTLVALGMPALNANATNTVGIWPGSLGSIWAFRRELARVQRRFWWLLIPAMLGGLIGAILLRCTPSNVFDSIIPWLVLFATVLFIVQAPARRQIELLIARRHPTIVPSTERQASPRLATTAIIVQFLVGIYGGYFGAGISIIMLAVLGMMGMTDILEMNAVTSVLSGGINGIAGLLFAIAGLIRWPYVAVMAIGAVLGGYLAAGLARRIGKTAIRRFVVGWGFAIAAVMFWRVIRR